MVHIKHFIKPRQFGKTYDCITESAKTGAVIVVRDSHTVKYLKKSAKERGLDIPDPVIATELAKGNSDIEPGTHLIVDDADLVLSSLLGYNHPIDIISMVSRDHTGLEEMSGHQRFLMFGKDGYTDEA